MAGKSEKKPSPTPETKVLGMSTTAMGNVAIIAGGLLLAACAILLYFRMSKEKQGE